MNFTKIDANTTAIIINNQQVGTIEKNIDEEAVMIPGTMLRRAQGRKVTRYSITVARRFFTNAPLTIGNAYGVRSLTAAKAEATRQIESLTLKG